MTGRELAEWIVKNHAEEMEVLFLQDDGIVTRINPEVMENRRIKEEYWEMRFLPEEGESVIL